MSEQPDPRSTPAIRVTEPVKARLSELAAAKSRKTGRNVTYSEIIGDLLEKAGAA